MIKEKFYKKKKIFFPVSIIALIMALLMLFSCLEPEIYSEKGANITLTHPNDGEFLNPGFEYEIKWTSKGIIDIDVELWGVNKENGKLEFVTRIAAKVSNTGIYVWEIPSDFAELYNDIYEVDSYIINLSGEDTSHTSNSEDSSDKSLTITIPTGVKITSPTNYDVWYEGETYDITYTHIGKDFNIKIDLYKGEELYSTIADSIFCGEEGKGELTWTVPSSSTDLYNEYDKGYKLVISEDLTSSEIESGKFYITDNTDVFLVTDSGPVTGEDIENVQKSIDSKMESLVDLVKVKGGECLPGTSLEIDENIYEINLRGIIDFAQLIPNREEKRKAIEYLENISELKEAVVSSFNEIGIDYDEFEKIYSMKISPNTNTDQQKLKSSGGTTYVSEEINRKIDWDWFDEGDIIMNTGDSDIQEAFKWYAHSWWVHSGVWIGEDKFEILHNGQGPPGNNDGLKPPVQKINKIYFLSASDLALGGVKPYFKESETPNVHKRMWTQRPSKPNLNLLARVIIDGDYELPGDDDDNNTPKQKSLKQHNGVEDPGDYPVPPEKPYPWEPGYGEDEDEDEDETTLTPEEIINYFVKIHLFQLMIKHDITNKTSLNKVLIHYKGSLKYTYPVRAVIDTTIRRMAKLHPDSNYLQEVINALNELLSLMKNKNVKTLNQLENEISSISYPPGNKPLFVTIFEEINIPYYKSVVTETIDYRLWRDFIPVQLMTEAEANTAIKEDAINWGKEQIGEPWSIGARFIHCVDKDVSNSWYCNKFTAWIYFHATGARTTKRTQWWSFGDKIWEVLPNNATWIEGHYKKYPGATVELVACLEAVPAFFQIFAAWIQIQLFDPVVSGNDFWTSPYCRDKTWNESVYWFIYRPPFLHSGVKNEDKHAFNHPDKYYCDIIRAHTCIEEQEPNR